MANVSSLRPAVGSDKAPSKARRRFAGASGQSGRPPYAAAGVAVAVVVLGVIVLALVSSGASLSADTSALVKVGMPLGGGSVSSVSVTSGPRAEPIPVDVRGDELWPRGLVPAHKLLTVEVVVRRPGWISWLAGSTQRLKLSLITPSAALEQHYLTLSNGTPLRLEFKQPVSAFSYGPAANKLQRHDLASPLDHITLARTADAGSVWVAAAPRRWESSKPTVVSWFPAGAAAAAVASPVPGSTIGPNTPISLTFSKPVNQALGNSMPPVSPDTPGTWHQQGSHTIVFQPQDYGYGLGSTVNIGLPNGIKLVGGQGGASATASWSVPSGSTLRLQQVLALLGYLPVHFHYNGAGVQRTPQAQEAAALRPPSGHWTWRYNNTPSALKGMWQPGTSGAMTRGAVMAFENDNNMTPDGIASAAVWKDLISSVVNGKPSHFGYSYVAVDEGSQSLNLWHNGRTVLTTPVNTGVASDPTATGVYPVFEHISSGTMSGTNADGSTYVDPGIPWISYFNGGDALHGYVRASYGSPQSDGCVEMPISTAGQVWPYTPVGTLVNVS